MKEYNLYNDVVMDHFLNPRNIGDVDGANAIGEVGAAACGDIMKISLKIRDSKIQDAKFKTFGCGSAIAASDMMCELIKGKTIDEAMLLTNNDVINALGGLPPVKIHCSVLAEEALKEAINNYKKKPKPEFNNGRYWVACTAEFPSKESIVTIDGIDSRVYHPDAIEIDTDYSYGEDTRYKCPHCGIDWWIEIDG